MHISVVIEAVNAGVGPCGACGQTKPRHMIAITTTSLETGKNIKVCKSCMTLPGVSFNVDLPVPTPGVGKALARRKKKALRAEAETAEEIGGHATLNSGGRFEDGDVVNEDWMVEQKDIEKRTYQLTARTLNKAMRQALKQGKSWVMRIRLPAIKHDLAVLPWNDVVGMIRGDE